MSNEEYKEYIIEMIQKIIRQEQVNTKTQTEKLRAQINPHFLYISFLSEERAGKPVFYYVKILFKYSFNTCL